MQKIISIIGPTASGKTKLAFQLAKHFNAALINADSVQIYKDLDIISGKDLPESKLFNSEGELECYQIDEIPLYLVDVVASTSDFNITDFIKKANNVLSILEEVKKMPILVGGSGFYIKGLLEGIDTVVSPNKQLRNKLKSLSVEELKVILKEKNLEKFQSLNNSDINNPRRLVRAIEISTSISKRKAILPHEVLTIGLLVERDELIHQIDERVDSRIYDGALNEAKNVPTPSIG
jgi:tRNA dimethylallyltransferase